MEEQRKNYYNLGHLCSIKSEKTVKKARLQVLLLACALLLVVGTMVVDVALAVDPIGDGTDAIIGIGGGTTPEGEGVIGSRSDARDELEGTIAGYWGEAGEFAGWALIIGALVFGVSFGLMLLRTIGGIPGAIAGLVGGIILAWSIWGIWDQATKGHIIPFVLVIGAAALSLTGRGWQADVSIAAVIIIYFSIILDPLVTKSGIWDTINFLRIFGAESWADLLGLE